MTKESDEFEQRIHRMLELIEGSGADVTWNDRIPDPDNPSQPRQIDITIRRDGAVTHAECRLHKQRQGVKWIEELYGRKVSLEAANIIAVSSSGFTRGAIRKAERLGVVLRDLQDLSPQEVARWGCTVEMEVYYYQYDGLKLVLLFRESDAVALDRRDDLADVMKTLPVRQSLFNASLELFDSESMTLEEGLKKHYRFEIKLRIENYQVCGRPVQSVEFSGGAQLRELDVRLPVALAYGAPQEKAANRRTLLQKMPDSDTGFIIHAPDRLATVIDVAKLSLPPNAQFRYVRTTASKTMDMDSVELLGTTGLYATPGPMVAEIVGIRD
jgi:Restriction endonuclease